MKVWITLSVLTLVAFAGCAEDAAPTDDDPNEPQFDDVDVADDKGVIRGVVLDPSITPIAGATVAVRGTEFAMETTDEGTFLFSDVEPGSHFIDVSKNGYVTTQTSVNVEAGEDKPDIVKVQLAVDETFQPDRTTFQYDGFLQCSFTLVVVGFNACGLGEIVGVPLDNPLVVHDVQGPAAWAQTEMVWESTQPLGDALSLMYSYGDCDGFYCDVEVEGPSPLLLSLDGKNLTEILADPANPDTPGLMIRVFGTESDSAQGTGLGATIDQRFTHYTTVFWGFTPDDGWLFTEDGEHPIPE